MGLLPGDLEKVPKEFSEKDCYQRIFEWHKKFGNQRLKDKYQRDDAYGRAYLALHEELPDPDVASQNCMDFIFGEVIYMLMEWSYHEQDGYGIKMGAYAHFAISKRYRGINDEGFKQSREKCSLHEEFGHPDKWSEEYE